MMRRAGLTVSAAIAVASCSPSNDAPVPRQCATNTTVNAPEPSVARMVHFVAEELANSDEPVTIRVFPHVIYAENDRGKLTETALARQLNALNKAFANTSFRFVDAKGSEEEQKHPSRFTQNRQWHYMASDTSAEAEAKNELHRGETEALNVYFVEPPKDLGWATMPWSNEAGTKQDGVVVLYSTVPGGEKKHYDEGDTLIHEVGHWLGLWHTFERGCPPPGDVVSDTAPEATESVGCDQNRDTCNRDEKKDPVDNYMDYSYDVCMVQFTVEQRERMMHEFYVYRSAQARALLRLFDTVGFVD